MTGLLVGATHRVLRNFKALHVEFDVYPRGEAETATVVTSSYGATPATRISGLLLSATPEERERYMQAQTIVNRVLVVEGVPPAAIGDRLVRVADGRRFYVAEAVDTLGRGCSTRLLLEERPDAQA